jgi:phage terminase small subunit
MPLTELQRRFVEEYLVTPNASDANRRAGGGCRTDGAVRVEAHRVLTNPNVIAALDEARAARVARTLVDADWVLEQLVEVVERCLQHEPVYDSQGNPTGVYRFDSAGAIGALKLLGMHLGLFDKRNRPSPKVDQAAYEAAMERMRQRGIDVSRAWPLPADN